MCQWADQAVSHLYKFVFHSGAQNILYDLTLTVLVTTIDVLRHFETG